MSRETLRKLLPWSLLFLAPLSLLLASGARIAPAELVFDNVAEVQTLDPATANGQQENRILIFLFEGLTVADPRTLEPRPGAASSWVTSADGLRHTFRLQEKGRWSNGDPVSARDFVDSWLRVLHPATGCDFTYLLSQVVNAEEYSKGLISDPEAVGLRAPDERTFVVELKNPVPYFLQLTFLWPLLPIHTRSIEAWKRKDPSGWRFEWLRPENLVTNGPYRIVERRVNDRIRLRKNPLYWDASNVRLQTVDALALESAATRLNLFESGQVHWTQQAPVAVVPELIARDRGRSEPLFHNKPFLAVYMYWLNVTRPPLDDRRVRQALARSVDRSRLTRYVTRRGEVPASSLIPPLIPGYEPASALPFDPGEARRLLAQAGYPGGRDFPKLEILYNTNELHRDIAEVIQDEWRRNLGIEVLLRNQEWKTYLDATISHDFWITRGGWIADYPDPNAFLEIFVTGAGNNRSAFADADYDRLIRRAAEERDPRRRLLTLREAEAMLIEEAPVIPLYFYVASNLVRPSLRGWHHNALDMHFPKFWDLVRAAEDP